MKNRQEFNEEAKKKEKKFKEDVANEGGFTKKDVMAMLIYAFATIFPICILVILALGLFVLWLFRAL